LRVATLAPAGLLLAGPSGHAGIFGLGYELDYGNAYLPPTGQSMAATSLHYREIGGPIGGAILALFLVPVKPTEQTTVTQEHECGFGGNGRDCIDYVKTTTTYPSEAEIDAYNKAVASFDPQVADAVMSGALGQELDMNFYARALGGSANGFTMTLWRGIAGVRNFQLGMFALGWISFHDVHTRTVTADTAELRATDKVADFTFKYAGLPVRFRTAIPNTRLGIEVQLDLNLLSIVMDQPSPIRGNIQWIGRHSIVKLGGFVSGFRPDGASLTAEAQLAF